MKKTITVIANCLVGSIVGTLSFIFPESVVLFNFVQHLDTDDGRQRVLQNAKRSDIVVVLTSFAEKTARLLEENQLTPDLIEVPVLQFTGFHPDLVYAKYGSKRELTQTPYNSAIVAWGYKHSLKEDHVVSLFNRRNMERLGYFERWDKEVAALRTAFSDLDYNFERFYHAVKRRGIFMYSVNHPRRFAAIEYTKLIAEKIERTALDKVLEVYIADGLWRTVWALYPEIGDFLGLRGGYVFQFQAGEKCIVLNSLRDYVRFSYEEYDKQGIEPDTFYPVIDNALYDKVLG